MGNSDYMRKRFPLPNEEKITREKVNDCLRMKRAGNSCYSMRLLAKRANVHQGTLSAYLSGSRSLDLETTTRILLQLKLSIVEISYCLSVSLNAYFKDRIKFKVAEDFMLALGDYSKINSFDCMSILKRLLSDQTFDSPTSLAQKTGVSEQLAQEFFSYLDELGFVKFDNGVWVKQITACKELFMA